MRFRFWPVGTASARRGSAHIQAYRYDGVPQADLHGADGTCLTVEQLRELRDMLSAVIARLEQVGAAALVSEVGFPRESFAALWDSINGERASWASNPWVWRVAFQRLT